MTPVKKQKSKLPSVDSSLSSGSMQEQIDDIRRLVEENLRYSKNAHQRSSKKGEKDDLKALLQENLKISKELLNTTKKIKKWLTYQRVWGLLKILIIIIPIVLGIIYLPPLLAELVEPYRELLNFGANPSASIENALTDPSLLEQLKNQFLNDPQAQQIIEAN